jgi:mRNA interferase MazF
VVSVDDLNHGPAGLVVVVPITTKAQGIPFHVEVPAQEGGLGRRSYIKCEDVRSISRAGLVTRIAKVPLGILAQVEDRLRILLGL